MKGGELYDAKEETNIKIDERRIVERLPNHQAEENFEALSSKH